ncbi:hypothetical protein CK203_054698 [Vitis vinifera]|uniref:Uncharacterized protein n=1 Tax=Vitis vinifera TaxID=29760 RepID=A0A438H1X9_VITVI|nr:hypothetical protein CK203_054698 [Vitis vinifera]
MAKSEIPTDFSKADLSNPYFTHHSHHPEQIGFVNGSIKAPSEEIDPEGYATCLGRSCERFSQSNAPRIFEIQRDIACLRQEQLSVSAYYTKLKGLWDELASYNAAAHGAQQDQQKLMQFLWHTLCLSRRKTTPPHFDECSSKSTASATMVVRSNSKSSTTWKDGIDRSNTGRMEPTDRPSGSQNFG